MSASPTPDIDRLSMEQRIRRLEARFPGGGGGGAGVGMPDFDQYPDNAVSDAPEGFILKVSIDDLANQKVPELSGMSLKYIYFWKWIASWGVFIPIVFCRAHLTRQLNNAINTDRRNILTNITIDNQDLLTDTFLKGWPDSNKTAMSSAQIYFYGFKTSGGVGAFPQNILPYCGIDVVIANKQNLSISILKPQTPIAPIYPCYMFGCSSTTTVNSQVHFGNINMSAGSVYGPIPYASRISVAQLTDLPVSALSLYPKSWCV